MVCVVLVGIGTGVSENNEAVGVIVMRLIFLFWLDKREQFWGVCGEEEQVAGWFIRSFSLRWLFQFSHIHATTARVCWGEKISIMYLGVFDVWDFRTKVFLIRRPSHRSGFSCGMQTPLLFDFIY